MCIPFIQSDSYVGPHDGDYILMYLEAIFHLFKNFCCFVDIKTTKHVFSSNFRYKWGKFPTNSDLDMYLI